MLRSHRNKPVSPASRMAHLSLGSPPPQKKPKEISPSLRHAARCEMRRYWSCFKTHKSEHSHTSAQVICKPNRDPYHARHRSFCREVSSLLAKKHALTHLQTTSSSLICATPSSANAAQEWHQTHAATQSATNHLCYSRVRSGCS